jgi:hypothetical protein
MSMLSKTLLMPDEYLAIEREAKYKSGSAELPAPREF